MLHPPTTKARECPSPGIVGDKDEAVPKEPERGADHGSSESEEEWGEGLTDRHTHLGAALQSNTRSMRRCIRCTRMEGQALAIVVDLDSLHTLHYQIRSSVACPALRQLRVEHLVKQEYFVFASLEESARAMKQ